MNLSFIKKTNHKRKLRIKVDTSEVLTPDLVQVTIDSLKIQQTIKEINPNKPRSLTIILRGGYYYSRFPLIPDKWFAISISNYVNSNLSTRKEYFFRKDALGMYQEYNNTITLFVDSIIIEALLNGYYQFTISTKNKGQKLNSKKFRDMIQKELADVMLEEIIHSQQNSADFKYVRSPIYLVIILGFLYYIIHLLSFMYPQLSNISSYIFYALLLSSIISVGTAIANFFPYFDTFLYPSDPFEKEAKLRKTNPKLQNLTNQAIQFKLSQSLSKTIDTANQISIKDIQKK